MKITLAKRREIATVLRKDVAAMAIPRPMVAGGTVVLAEFFAFTGNASTAACRILEMLPPDSDLGSGYSTIGTSFTSSWLDLMLVYSVYLAKVGGA
ncbi:hypothetical protein BHE74_00028215 [Ensete ventricosum]|nr:hypothetical protein BHE74_00028215 [Ensete ventricosum]